MTNSSATDGPTLVADLSWPPVDEPMIEAVVEYMRAGGTLSAAGREGVVAELEDEIAAAHGCRYGLAMSSGTAALAAAFFACDLPAGARVIGPAYTYHATVSPLLQHEVELVLCDVEADTGNISVPALAEQVNERTAAIVTNHQWGHPVDVDGIRTVLESCGQRIKWVEDCSHAHYAEHQQGRVGSFGDVSVFSLQGNKLVPAGEGGMLLTNDAEIHDRASLFAYSLKRTEAELIDPRYRPLGRTGIGLKHRIHPLGAAIALHCVRNRVEEWLIRRTELLTELSAALAPIPGIDPPVEREYVKSRGAFYGYKPRFDPLAFSKPVSREELVARVVAHGVPAKVPGSDALYRLSLFRDCPIELPARVAPIPVEGLAGTEAYSRTIVGLPTLTDPNQRPLVSVFADAFRAASAELLAEVGDAKR